jgi:hypothetical protein
MRDVLVLEGEFFGQFGKALVIGLGRHVWALPVLFAAIHRKDVYMSMRHIKAHEVYADAFGTKHFFDPLSYYFTRCHNCLVVLVWQVPEAVYLVFGNNQGVAGVGRVDVQKSKRLVVLVHLFARDFAFDDFGKDRVFHELIVR